MDKSICLNDEELQIVSHISSAFGSESFETSEITYLLLACNLLAATESYTNYDLTAKIRGLFEITSDKVREFKHSQFKINFPETESLLNLLERRINYQDIV